jgi:hypothetical protein
VNAGTPSTRPADRTAPRPVARRRFVLVALVFPLVVVLAAAAAQVLLIPDLTATVPTHWGPGGVVDGWGPAWTFPAITAGIGSGVVALLAAIGLSGVGQADGNGPGQRLRFLAASTVFTGVFLAICLSVSGAGDENLGPHLVVGLLTGAALGGLAAWWVYRVTWDVEGEDAPIRPAAAPLAQGADTTWFRRVGLGKVTWIINGAVVALCAVIVVVAVVDARRNPVGAAFTLWVSCGVAALVLLMVPTLTSVTVRVDASGLSIRGLLGFPRLSAKTQDIERAEVLPVSAMGQFGGWGWRYSPGSGWGVIMRSGEAVQVTRTNGSSLTVTVDDAVSAAALLNAYVQRAGASGAPGAPEPS